MKKGLLFGFVLILFIMFFAPIVDSLEEENLYKEKIKDISQKKIEMNERLSVKLIGRYNILPIWIIIVILYLISYFLVKTNKINIVLHKRIWNLILLVCFLVLAILSVLLVLRLEYGIVVSFIDLTFWHVEFGLVMLIIAFFHVLWHIPYYKSYFKRKKKLVENPEPQLNEIINKEKE
ncbi:hypothetical protein GOV12_02805 [Candidatus Pacearchaeota archaeon]|nr:hypothetical protein [Candidatus Pacearchaeota archaeon]